MERSPQTKRTEMTELLTDRHAYNKTYRKVGSLNAAASNDSTMWGFLYKTFAENLGVSPDKFQLVYPYEAWNWPSASSGHMSAAAYDFMSTLPQWSAVGAYESSGVRLSDAYLQFLNALVVDTDPVQRQKIEVEQDAVQDISNDYNQKLQDARDAYKKQVPDGSPDFTSWLADQYGGYTYGKQLASLQGKLDEATEFLKALVDQAQDPNYKAAMNQFMDQQYKSKIDTSSAEGSLVAPGYMISTTYDKWVTSIQGGGGTPATLAWSNSDSHYDFSKTWAGGDAEYGSGFFGIYANGSWEESEWMASDSNISVELNVEAWTTIPIQDSGWFNPAYVNNKASSEYRQGYGWDTFFGEKGSMASFKTGMLVSYKPSFTISTSSSWSEEQTKKFKAAGGLRIGPFKFGASGGHDSVIYNSEVTSNTFSGGSDSNLPQIMGVNIDVLGGAH